MKVGDTVKLNKEFLNQKRYPWSELAKARYFIVLRLPDEYGTVKLQRGDLASHGIEYYHESFLAPV